MKLRSLFAVAALEALSLYSAITLPAPAERIHCGSPEESVVKGAYYTGRYDDLFAELLLLSESSIDQTIDSAFTLLFFGDGQSQRICYTGISDTTIAYIEDIANEDVRTEGMSYGMMIAVQMNRKDLFDKIWKWAKTYMQVKGGPHKGYFAWHCRTDGTIIDSNAASDGEEWFVMSLYFASARWGDGVGIFDYRNEADNILNTMLHKEEEPGHDGVTDMFDKTRKLVVFVPTEEADWFTDPSYQLPHFYELWSMLGARDRAFWAEAADSSRDLLRGAADPKTGLSPDYCMFDGTPVTSWRGRHGDFRFDAWRVAMNVAVDYEWFGKCDWEVTECNRLLDFFTGRGIASYGNQYRLDGTELSGDHSTGLVAMNAVAALASTNPDRKNFVEALWNTPVPSGRYRYYDGMLYMLAMLQVGGRFRIYGPGGGPY